MTRNGQYYFYFTRGRSEIGVVRGDTPAGPWKDPLGKPLIASGSTPTTARDPGILQEKDGTSYIVFGVFEYYIARLNEDMISLAETPRKILLDQKMGPMGPGKTDDKPFLHRRSDIYYLSWGCYYAMSDNVYGPYAYKDSIIKVEHTDSELQKQAQGLTSDRHGSFFELHNQWYFGCNDKSWPGTNDHYRDSVISYVHYRDNGEMRQLSLG
jgi:beta-xylosidase